MHLDTKLNFQEHLDNITSKVDKSIGLLHKLQAVLLSPSLVTIYKAFRRPHFDYEDIIYDQTYKESFHQKLESIQYHAALAITGTIEGTSREKLNLRIIFPKYFLVLGAYNTRNVDYIPCFSTKHNFFRNSFFPSTLI